MSSVLKAKNKNRIGREMEEKNEYDGKGLKKFKNTKEIFCNKKETYEKRKKKKMLLVIKCDI